MHWRSRQADERQHAGRRSQHAQKMQYPLFPKAPSSGRMGLTEVVRLLQRIDKEEHMHRRIRRNADEEVIVGFVPGGG